MRYTRLMKAHNISPSTVSSSSSPSSSATARKVSTSASKKRKTSETVSTEDEESLFKPHGRPVNPGNEYLKVENDTASPMQYYDTGSERDEGMEMHANPYSVRSMNQPSRAEGVDVGVAYMRSGFPVGARVGTKALPETKMGRNGSEVEAAYQGGNKEDMVYQ